MNIYAIILNFHYLIQKIIIKINFIIMINIVVMIVILRAEIANTVFAMQQIVLKDIPLN